MVSEGDLNPHEPQGPLGPQPQDVRPASTALIRSGLLTCDSTDRLGPLIRPRLPSSVPHTCKHLQTPSQ